MINTKLQSIIDTKSAIGNAIVNKGGTINSATPFFNYAAQIDGISTGSTLTGNATANQVFNGQTFYSNDANTQLTGTFVAPQIDGTDETKMLFVNNSISTSETIENIAINNGFIYAATDQIVSQFHESNLVFVNNTASYGQVIAAISINNGAIFVGGRTTNLVRKYNESTLSLETNSANYGGNINAVAINDGFIYVGGQALTGTNRGITKYHEGNLALVGANLAASSTGNYGGTILTVAINDGFIYAGGLTANVVRKYNESTLAIVGNTANYGAAINTIAINNGFIYVGGRTANVVRKYNESTLAIVGNTASYGGEIYKITTNNGFIYVGGLTNQTVQKFHESNLAFVGNTVRYGGNINAVAINNGFIYAGGETNETIQKFHEATPFTNALNGQAWYLVSKE